MELDFPPGKVVRTVRGGADALRSLLVDLKRYSFTGYVRVHAASSPASEGYIVIVEGAPELAVHVASGKRQEGKVALRAIWQDSYTPACELAIHAKVDVVAIRHAYPAAILEKVRRPRRKVTRLPAREVEAKLRGWRAAGYDDTGILATLQRGGEDAQEALDEFEEAVDRMDPLRKELETIGDGAPAEDIANLKRIARNPLNVDEVSEALGKLREQTPEAEPEAPAPEPAPAPSTVGAEADTGLQDRARQVFEMIVRRRAAEGRPTGVSENQVVQAIEGPPTTRDERTNLVRQFTFDAFIVGPSNRFAHAASVAVAKSPHTAYNPLFITSGPGLGKTHLLTAIGNQIREDDRRAKVVYVTAEGFGNEFKEASAEGRLQEFRKKFRGLDVILLDDAQFFSGRGDVQEELFHTFNDLYTKNKQIVLTSDRMPKEIPDLEDRLVSRFESGLIADIQRPEYETRMAILRRKARDSGLNVDEEVLNLIARLIEDNVRELLGAFNRVLAFSSLMDQPVSLEVAKEVLRDLGGREARRVEARVSRAEREIRAGHSYLVEEDRPEHAFRLFSSAITKGGRALVVTRTNPKRAKDKHGVPEARTLWLTERESRSLETIPPSLERIIYVIEEFMDGGGSGAILLDGIEYLVSSNSFDAVLKFLRRLVDHTSESQFVLIVSVSTKTMKEQETKNLEREMEVITF